MEVVLGKYSVPENIRKMKPTGTVVKVLNGGKYYVYEQKHIKVDGKWKIKSGKMIGTLEDGVGFIPNDNYKKDDKITTVDFGEYCLANYLSLNTLNLLKEVFNIKDALNIYLLALIHFVNGFTHIKNVKPLYDLSYLSIKYPTLSLSNYIVTKMLDDLGRRQQRVEDFEDLLLKKSSKQLAIDGHAIKTSSNDNALSEKGYKSRIFKDKQINLLMAYDINNHKPILSRIFDGSAVDSVIFKDFFERREFKDTLFIVDKGFYSNDNLELLSKDNNSYIIPQKNNMKDYKEITKDTKCEHMFVYERGKKKSVVEYKELTKEKYKVIFYKDLSQNATEAADYYKKINEKTYTIEKYNVLKEFFGTIVLQTNLSENAQEVYKLYKQRWLIETFYDYYKNRLDANTLCLQDYYQTQGLSFILLITSLIHSDFSDKIKQTGKTISDLLLNTRFLKLHKKRGVWSLENTSRKHYELFSSLGISLDNELSYMNGK